MGKLKFILPSEVGGSRLDKAIATVIPSYSRGQIQKWLKNGSVQVNNDPVLPKLKVWGGEIITIDATDDKKLDFAPEPIHLSIIYEDQSIIVINKPAGLVMHPGNGNWNGTLLNGLLNHNEKLTEIPRAGIVHRLDKETSGLLVVAKTLTAQLSLVKQLQSRSVYREYIAVVCGQLTTGGKVNAPIGRHPINRTKMAITQRGKPAVTHYLPLEKGKDWTLVKCWLETGRTHQIRVHLTHIGHPLIGDPIYKRKLNKVSFPRQALNASKLTINHPESKSELSWKIPIPQDMSNLLSILRENDIH